WDFPGSAPKARESMDSALERIVQEETGLTVSRIVDFVGDHRFRAPWYTIFQKRQRLLFIVETNDHDIMLNTKKHSAFCWADWSRVFWMFNRVTKVKDIEMAGNEVIPREDQW
ncbi:hypothetical protein F5883DRAFT_360866, partial [Diaporthe sp. PMI_573]